MVTSEAITPQLVAKEEKLREKRLLKQQQDNSKPISSDNIAENEKNDRTPISTPDATTTTAGLKRKRSLLQKSSDSIKKQKVSSTVTASAPVTTAPLPTTVAASTSAATPTPTTIPTTIPAQVIPHTPEKVSNVTQLLLQQQPQQPPPPTSVMPQPKLPNMTKTDTVLVRLTSGQVVLVPRELLKKVNPAISVANTTVTTSTVVPTLATTSKVLPTLSAGPYVVKSNVEQLPQRTLLTAPSVKRDLPVNVSLNEALDILRQKYSTAEVAQTPIQVAKPNGILKQNLDSNGKSFSYVKIRAFQGPGAPTTGSAIGTTAQSASSLSEQLVKIQQMPAQIMHHQTIQQQQQHQQQLQHHQPHQPIVVQRTVSMPTMTRFVQQPSQPGIIRRIIVPQNVASSFTQIRPAMTLPRIPVTHIRPTIAMPGIFRSNGTIQSGSGPMKICIIQSPRKLDGTPVSPGSTTPGIVIGNPPTNLRQLNINDVLKAIAAQNASTVMQQNVTMPSPTNVITRTQNVPGVNVNIAGNVTQMIVGPTETTNGLVKSQVS